MQSTKESIVMQEKILGIVRHILTAAGGGLIASGTADEATVQTIVGGIIAAAGVVWSWFNKRKAKVEN